MSSEQVTMKGVWVGLALAAALLGQAGDARAQVVGIDSEKSADPPETALMRRAMHAYFEGETREAWAFGGAGIVTLGGGGAMFAASDHLYRGAAFPLVAVGVIELAAGIVLLARTDAQVADLDRRLDAGKHDFLDREAPRMEKVRAEFGLLEVVELSLVAVGLGLASYGGARSDHTWTGLGGGLALQSAAMLTFDTHASARADAYASALRAYAR